VASGCFPRDRIGAVCESGERLIQADQRRIEDDGLDFRHALHRAWTAPRQDVDLHVELQPLQLQLRNPRLARSHGATAQTPHGPMIVTQPDGTGEVIAAEIIHCRAPAAPEHCKHAIWQRNPGRATDRIVTRT
jgi:hypothetical protein